MQEKFSSILVLYVYGSWELEVICFLMLGNWRMLLNLWFSNSFKIINYAGSSFFIS